ncbi:hypothetical protein [Methylomarinum vadi]|uniref:hypothetical protein n=1 Tax=Methylomarinum vadi TaxID=438855 RepID=UPI00190F303A|nr:hypothetical protein [Methylomarinum vadi]
MNSNSLKARTITALVICLFMVLGVGPIPLTSTFGLFIVMFRPRWFKQLVSHIYSG